MIKICKMNVPARKNVYIILLKSCLGKFKLCNILKDRHTYIYIINKKPRDWNMLHYCTTDSLYHCTNTTCNELEVKQFFFFITVEAHQNSAVFKPNQISLAFNYVIL